MENQAKLLKSFNMTLDGNKVFKWSVERNGYLFIGTLGERTVLQFIEDHNEIMIKGL